MPVEDNDDALIAIGSEFSGKILAIDTTMKAHTGDQIFVRSRVVPMLEMAQCALRKIAPDCDLEVVCGYRHLDVQRQQFQDQIQHVLRKAPSLSGEELKEAAHRFSAVPEVAGHPTGGAVDVRIMQSNGEALSMGTDLGEDSMDTYVFSPFIEREHWRNRQNLRFCMLRAGFAPFDGEWWHFSFGDREWARYFNKEKAIYNQLSFTMDKGMPSTSR
ncbi:D-alanyl-D-alanine carboxypeptidase family protein [Mesorhizobium australicum]|uniref:M15 family metallopeptidase n=1 Tax=Mesorhizobium australicum TaxID=536018 RepID=UPI003337EBC0